VGLPSFVPHALERYPAERKWAVRIEAAAVGFSQAGRYREELLIKSQQNLFHSGVYDR
jgi:hypothetical protein